MTPSENLYPGGQAVPSTDGLDYYDHGSPLDHDGGTAWPQIADEFKRFISDNPPTLRPGMYRPLDEGAGDV
ncbi:hypothetical protein [Parafrankia discariae]|uniref:hypothetical protein n=1 Tax=Parafrankia discariae TaxID=365528 RepID=UPI0003A9554D|nr:hypothetical protein [Parafrankia discariae]